MKKIIGIIVAIALFIASLATNVWYLFDGDSTTTANVQEVVDKGKDVYDAFTIDKTATTETQE